MPKPLVCNQPSHADHAQLYEILVAELGDFAIFLIDPDGCIATWNPGVKRILGYTEEEWVGQPIEIIFTPEDRAHGAPAKELRTALQKGRASDNRWHLRKNGKRLYVEGTLVALRDDAGRLLGFSKILRDMTQRKQEEEALRASEARFRAVFHSAAIGVARVSFEGARWLEVNDAFCRILGYAREELIGHPWPMITHPDDIDLDLKPFERMARGEIDTYTVEKRFIHKQGHFVWARLTLSLVRDAQGQPDFEVCLMEDITARKHAEEALRRSNEDLQRFGYVVSHDLQEPLRQVAVYSQLLARKNAGADPETDHYCQTVVDGTKHMQTLIRDLLVLALPDTELSPERFNVAEVFEIALGALEERLKEAHGRVMVETALPELVAPRVIVGQVFQNLLSNAIKHRHAGRAPEIRIAAARHAGEWVFSVSDNGPGIPPEYRARLFEWFSRVPGTRAAGRGIGLASSARLLERIGGRIWVEDSDTGTGSIFRFTVPIAQEAKDC